jgi:hypothetical protein
MTRGYILDVVPRGGGAASVSKETATTADSVGRAPDADAFIT